MQCREYLVSIVFIVALAECVVYERMGRESLLHPNRLRGSLCVT